MTEINDKDYERMKKQILAETEKRFSDDLDKLLANAFELEKKRSLFVITKFIILLFFSSTAFLVAAVAYKLMNGGFCK